MHRTTLELLTNIINDPPDAFESPRASLPRAINTFHATRAQWKDALRIAHKARVDAFSAEQRARHVRSAKLQEWLNDAPAELADDIARNEVGLKAAIIKCVLSRWASENSLRRLKDGEGDDLGYARNLSEAEERAHRNAYPNGTPEPNDQDIHSQATSPSPMQEET